MSIQKARSWQIDDSLAYEVSVRSETCKGVF